MGKQLWSAQDDAALMEHIANGISIEKSGKLLGKTKGQAIGRFNRLRQSMGPQAV